ncbi:aldehyde dehydrogenase (NADP(+)) [Bailinhaonella thermotolerans]|nr:aldehyde dehydrogenase (NADP(+)) [Bailinhaonella thermotolerans]
MGDMSQGSVAVAGVGEVAEAVRRAVGAAGELEGMGREGRAALLGLVAEELEAVGEEIVAVADRETGLGTGRLTGELARTCFQLRFFGEVIRDGAYLEVAIDHADADAVPAPRPDLRRMLVPRGPVAVFGASNFPLAFSVPGGDTASALAAGCPVVVKAHPAHPETSRLAAAAIERGIARAGGPAGAFSLVEGFEAGAALVTDPRITAVGFTGSERGGRALYELAATRPEPIPFYGELGSVNPLVVTPGAAAARAEEIGRGAADSVTLGMGQFCTKPGLIFVPAGADGERLVDALVARARELTPGRLLTGAIRDAYREAASRAAGVLLAEDDPAADVCGATITRVPAGGEIPADEVFGPYAVIVEYASVDGLLEALSGLRPALVATVHAEDHESDTAVRLTRALLGRSGRLVWNGYPTGVAVSWAMTHGGPYPATTDAGHTSVGAGAIRRWLRPVTYQSVPHALLPPELRDDATGVPRRVNGRPA